MKAIQREEDGKTFVVNDNVQVMLKELDAAGVKMGRTSLSELLSGKREIVAGFKLVDVEVQGQTQTGDDQNKGDTNNGQAVVGGENQGNATGTDTGGTNATATQQSGDQTQAAAATTTEDNKPAQARKTIRASEPKGKIKGVRGGTKIAKGLELLMKGATLKQLTDAELSDDLPDFCNRRVTKRGYGIEVIEGKKGENGQPDTETIYKLKFPNGTDKITYSAGGPDEVKEDSKANNLPADATKEEVKAAEAADDKSTPAEEPAAEAKTDEAKQ